MPVRSTTPPPSVEPAASVRDPRLNEADRLEQQAAPPPAPHGLKENLVAGLQAAGNAFANPHGYQQLDLQKKEMERQREQDLIGRAKELRLESQSQQRIGLEERHYGDEVNWRTAQANLQEKHYQDEAAHQKDQERIAAINAAKPKVGAFPAGSQPYIEDASGVRNFGPAVPKDNKNNLSNLSKETVLYQGKPTDVMVDLDPESPTKGRSFLQTATGMQDISGQTQHYEPPAKYGEPLELTFDPTRGANVYAPRSRASGAVGPQPAGTLKEARETENSARKISVLESAYKDDFVGPAAGRYYAVKAKLPGTSLPEGYGTFMQAQADLKNSVIKLITGAQMGQQEADRILQQVPTENDKPEIWKAKFAATKTNVDYLNGLLQQQIGGGAATPASPKKTVKFSDLPE